MRIDSQNWIYLKRREKGAFKRHFAMLFLLILTAHVALAQTDIPKVETSLSVGVLNHDLSWSIAGNLNGQNPNIYSELIWEDVRSVAVKGGFGLKIWKHLMMHADLWVGFTVAGSATDTDYQDDNRTSQVFFASLQSDQGTCYAVRPSVGYTFSLSGKITLTPGLGYGLTGEKLYLLDQMDLNSTYMTQWKGPFAKAKIGYAFSAKLNAGLSLTYHQIDYLAKADWNLVDYFEHPVSFKHYAKGYGVEGGVLLNYRILNNTSAFISLDYFKWSTGTGIDELFLTDGTRPKTRLNDVTRTGFNAVLGVAYRL